MHKLGFLIILMIHSILHSCQSQSNKVCESLWNENTRDTPLCFAIRHNNQEEAEALLSKGCDINKCNNFGHTPLMLAAAHNNIEMCKWLLHNNAEINAYSCDGTALSAAVTYNNFEAAMFLIEQGADVDQGNQFNYNTPLDKAATYGRELMMQLLLKHRVDINPKLSKVEYNPLAKAIFWGHSNIVLLLLQAGANIFQAQEIFTKTTYLHIAAENNRIDITKLLLEYDANPLQVDGSNRKPIDVARNVKIKNLLANAEQYRCLLLVAQHLREKHFHFASGFFVNVVCEWLGY